MVILQYVVLLSIVSPLFLAIMTSTYPPLRDRSAAQSPAKKAISVSRVHVGFHTYDFSANAISVSRSCPCAALVVERVLDTCVHCFSSFKVVSAVFHDNF